MNPDFPVYQPPMWRAPEPQMQFASVKFKTPYNTSENTNPTKPIQKDKKIGRNELCDCGSGLKYKKCVSGSKGSRIHLNHFLTTKTDFEFLTTKPNV
jgi:hypothetical protein